jgi:four helix bundle protein
MATISKFEDIVAWQQSQQLTLAVYKELKYCKDFSFRDQIQRASVSIMNNIAEGFDRKGDKEFRHFLFIAKGSCAEVRSMLSLADKLGYMNSDSAKQLTEQSFTITKMLSSYIAKLDRK